MFEQVIIGLQTPASVEPTRAFARHLVDRGSITSVAVDREAHWGSDVTLSDESDLAHAVVVDATERGADLIVVDGASPAASSRPDAELRRILHDAPCAVAVVRGTPLTRRPHSIGVAFDHSDGARVALALAEQLALHVGASLELTHVIDSTTMADGLGMNPLLVLDDLQAITQANLDDVVEGLHVPAVCAVPVGTPGGMLHDLSERQDLVVCGTHGGGALRRFALGSTSDDLVRHAACPVIVVPRHAHMPGLAHRILAPESAHRA